MTVSVEDLEDLYDSYSDGEILRLYTSGNLTEVAKKVALNEIKLRRLTIPANVSGDSDPVEEKSRPEFEMRIIANNLRFDEAIILSEAMIAEGITSDTQGSNIHNAFFPSGFNHLVRVDERYFQQALTIYEQFKKSQPSNNEERAEGEADIAKQTKFSDLSKEEQRLVRQVEMRMAMFAIGFLAIMLLVAFNMKSIVRVIGPYITPNIAHGLLLLLSVFVLKVTVTTNERGTFKGPNGQETTKEEAPFAFGVEVIGGYVLFGILFIYGIQYFLNISILPTNLTMFEGAIKVMLKVLLQSLK